MDTTYLVIGGTGRTGRRIAHLLAERGHDVRVTSRSHSPAFDWQDPQTWDRALEGVDRAYVSFSPDIAMPGAAEILAELTASAVGHGLQRVVLLSGRGEELARQTEARVTALAPQWTVLRSSFFMQNFSEHFLLDAVRRRLVVMPAGGTAEPFVHLDDLAQVAVSALTTDAWLGRTLELTGPRLLSFADVATGLTSVLGDPVTYLACTVEEFAAGAVAEGMGAQEARVLAEVFAQVLDGRNAHLTDDLAEVLGHPGRDFTDYARSTAATGLWSRATDPEVGSATAGVRTGARA